MAFPEYTPLALYSRLTARVDDHDRRLNALGGDMAQIRTDLAGIREDFNVHAQEMLKITTAVVIQLRIIIAVSTIILAATVAVVGEYLVSK